MSDFVIYRLSDGEICISGTTPEPTTVRVPPGAALLVDNSTDPPTFPAGSNDTHYVANGELAAYTPEQAAAKAARPDYAASWSNTTFQWVDTRTLDQAKLEQWALVKAARDAVVNGLFTWSGSVFQIDADSRARIGEAVTLAQLAQSAGNNAFTVTWTLADNTTRALSIADLFALGAAVGAFFQPNWSQGQALYGQIQAAQTVDAVKAIVWTPPAG